MTLMSKLKCDFWRKKKKHCVVPKETAIVFILVNGPLPPVLSEQGEGGKGETQPEACLKHWLSEWPCPAVRLAARSSITVTPPSSPCPIHQQGPSQINSLTQRLHLQDGIYIPELVVIIFEVKINL